MQTKAGCAMQVGVIDFREAPADIVAASYIAGEVKRCGTMPRVLAIRIALALALVLPAAGCETTLVRHDDERIQYVGRVFVGDDAAHFDWAGVRIRFRTDAPSVGLRLRTGGSDYNVFVEDSLLTVIRDDSVAVLHQLELGDGSKTVDIVKRNGPNFGEARFAGVEVGRGSQISAPPPRRRRQIEFVGDSQTVGYGNEGPGRRCESLRPWENNWLSWASVAARELGTESHVIAVSGSGVVRNYGEPGTASEVPLPAVYGRTVMRRPHLQWDSRDWRADLVIVWLGTNDTSTEPHPAENDFVDGYRSLLRDIERLHGRNVPLVLLVSYRESSLKAWILKILAREEAAGREGVRVVVLPDVEGADEGCDYHPNVSAHAYLARFMIPRIREAAGWN